MFTAENLLDEEVIVRQDVDHESVTLTVARKGNQKKCVTIKMTLGDLLELIERVSAASDAIVSLLNDQIEAMRRGRVPPPSVQ